MATFSKGTLDALYGAGWNEERKIDTATYEQSLRTAGYKSFPIVLDFLSRFGDLEIKYPDHHVPTSVTGFSLNLLETLETISSDDIDTYSRILKLPLTVIGMTYDHEWILMAINGKVFIVFDNWIVEAGESGEDAIEAICSGRELKKIPHPRGHQL